MIETRGSNPIFYQNCTLSSISWSIHNRFACNLHNRELILWDDEKGSNSMFWPKHNIIVIILSKVLFWVLKMMKICMFLKLEWMLAVEPKNFWMHITSKIFIIEQKCNTSIWLYWWKEFKMSMLHLQSSVFMDITVSRYTMLIIIHVLCRRSLRLLGFLGLHFVAAQICWICAKCALLKSIGGGGSALLRSFLRGMG